MERRAALKYASLVPISVAGCTEVISPDRANLFVYNQSNQRLRIVVQISERDGNSVFEEEFVLGANEELERQSVASGGAYDVSVETNRSQEETGKLVVNCSPTDLRIIVGQEENILIEQSFCS